MITILNHQTESIAKAIYQVFQVSYQIEADLIGVIDFPPLNRTVSEIKDSKTEFHGFYDNNDLAGIIEINHYYGVSGVIVTDTDSLKICSLTVDPQHFRKGIAGKMIQYIFNLYQVKNYEVETAVVNIPAISLYKKHGFVEYSQYLPDHGIPKIVMKKRVL